MNKVITRHKQGAVLSKLDLLILKVVIKENIADNRTII